MLRSKIHDTCRGTIAIFGGVLIIGFPLSFLTELTFVQNAVETEGVYVGINNSAEFENSSQVFIRFVDASGTERQETIRRSTATMDMTPGDRLPIVYDSRNPSSIRVDEFSEKWGATIAVVVLFTFGCGVSSFLYFFTKPDEFWSKPLADT